MNIFAASTSDRPGASPSRSTKFSANITASPAAFNCKRIFVNCMLRWTSAAVLVAVILLSSTTTMQAGIKFTASSYNVQNNQPLGLYIQYTVDSFEKANVWVNVEPVEQSSDFTFSGSKFYVTGSGTYFAGTFTAHRYSQAQATTTIAASSGAHVATVDITYPQLGSLQVTISPPGAANYGAKWSVDGGTWQNSGATVTLLTAGQHGVAFLPVANWVTPPNQSVTINVGQTTTASGTYGLQYGSLQVTISPPDAVIAGARWNVDYGPWHASGDTVPVEVIGDHFINFSPTTGWITPHEQSVTITANNTATATGTYVGPHAAKAKAVLVNGFVVSATITDKGYGYTDIPSVYILGGGGNGAMATATVSNGVISAINILNAGSDYTDVPTIVVAPPFLPLLKTTPAIQFTFTNLTVATTYQLQFLQLGAATNVGSPFVTTEPVYSKYDDVLASGCSYRLYQLPTPCAAIATPQVSFGFLVGATVTSGGSGYVTAPNVTIIGGGGNGAQAVATITNGTVSAINIVNAGSGYTGMPDIQIDPPPIPTIAPAITQAIRVDCSGLFPNLSYQFQASPDLIVWTNFSATFTATSSTNSMYLDIGAGGQFLRLQCLP